LWTNLKVKAKKGARCVCFSAAEACDAAGCAVWPWLTCSAKVAKVMRARKMKGKRRRAAATNVKSYASCSVAG
jgi:hypothetical protein